MIWIAWALGLIAGFLVVYLLIPIWAKRVLRRQFLDRIRKSGCTCLTFDDGPHPQSTPKILDSLKENGVKATFYPIGKYADKYPQLMERIVHEGHEIGEHSYEHVNALKTGPMKTLRDLMAERRTIARFHPQGDAVSFRPAYGKLNLASLIYMYRFKRAISFWNIDPRDYEQTTGKAVADFVNERMKPGAVILLHDGRVDEKTQGLEITVEALQRIMNSASNRGLRFNTITAALETGCNEADR